MRREMGLVYLMRKYIFSLLNRINKFSEVCLPQPFIFKFPDLSLTFQGLSKFPRPSTKFPDFSLTWKKFQFPDIFPWPWQPCVTITSTTATMDMLGIFIYQEIVKLRKSEKQEFSAKINSNKTKKQLPATKNSFARMQATTMGIAKPM